MSDQHPGYAANAARAVASRIGEDLPNAGYVHARIIQAEVSKLANSADALGVVFETRSPTETVEAHTKKVGLAARAYSEQIGKARERMHDAVRQGLADIEQRSRQRTNFKADAFAPEVRASVRNLQLENQMVLLTDLARQGRGPELAAVIDAPLLLTGVSEEMARRYRDTLETFHAPAEQEERKVLLAVFGRGFDVSALCANAAAGLSDPSQLAAIERAEQKAAAAMSAFQSAAQA